MKPMSFAARVRDAEWKLKHGYSVLSPGRRIGRTFAGKIVLPSEPTPQPPALPGDNNGAAADSKLNPAASPSAGHFMNDEGGRMNDEVRPTTAKLGLRYER